MIRVGVTGPSGDVGHGIMSGLRESILPLQIVGLDRNPHFPAGLACESKVLMPPVAADDYVSTLIQVIKAERIQYLFCGIDSEVPILARNRLFIKETTGCIVIVARESLVDICVDKVRTAKWLDQIGVPTPKTWTIAEAQQLLTESAGVLPLIRKPRIGRSSVGVRILRSESELQDELLQGQEDLCLQEYLPGDEYTCGLLFDSNGILSDSIISRRELSGGRTMIAEFLQSAEVAEVINMIGQHVKCIGALNVQLRLNTNGRPCVFEINPRISGSTIMRLRAGYNEPARILENLVTGNPIESSATASGMTLREWSVVHEPVAPTDAETLDAVDTLVFDCGGTLLHLAPAVEAICHRVLKKLGYTIPLKKVEQAYQLVDFATKRESSKECGEPDRSRFYTHFNRLLANALGIGRNAERFHAALYDACSAGNMHWTPLPDVVNCLKQLQSRYRLLVLANWDSNLNSLLHRHGLDHFFECVIDSQTIGVEKPAPEAFSSLFLQGHVDPSRAAYIGNEYEADVIGSRNMGLTPVLLDHRSHYCAGVDAAYFTSWKTMTAWLMRSNDPGAICR